MSQRILVAVDVDVDTTGEAIAIVNHLMRKVEWPNEVASVEVGEVQEFEDAETT